MSITSIIIVVLSWLITLGGSFWGGTAYKSNEIKKLPPKDLTINNDQTTVNNNTSIQESRQDQVTMTVITGRTQYFINVNYKGGTNISRTFARTTNTVSKTN